MRGFNQNGVKYIAINSVIVHCSKIILDFVLTRLEWFAPGGAELIWRFRPMVALYWCIATGWCFRVGASWEIKPVKTVR